ncbi:acyl-CoA dehydrogenase family protein [Fulvivirga sediminis]|uniref:Acyl-CoA dehydrogenase family protein n=1 Tax=Fulvivirga sediminis TaxID=2803949 RepID=A0A937K1M0_9BACT|nr:acyl-CoA dehydrogenase family protein [Fulvivirga sediminis]MBL3658734.1 acyl-CoA dehydrogenase family protein [Fulvivirga sediminis]
MSNIVAGLKDDVANITFDIQKVRQFVNEEIRPITSEFDKNQQIPETLISKLAGQGYLASNFPTDFGGLGLDPLQYGQLTEEIGRVSPAVRSVLTVHCSLVGESIMRWGSEQQKNTFLPKMASGEKLAAFALSEPSVGSDAGSIATSYVKVDNGFVINGKKKWITMGARANLLLVIATSEGRVSAFLVDSNTVGVERHQIMDMMAGRAAYTAEISFEDVFVPDENLLGNEGGGFTYVVNTALDHGRYSIAWAGLAVAQEALHAMVKYARKRKQFGTGIHNHQLVQEMISNAVVNVEAARALCVKAAKLRAEQHEDATIHTTIAKQFASKTANTVASDALQIHGANGFTSEFIVEQLFREAKVFEVIEGSTQILHQVIARHGLTTFHK